MNKIVASIILILCTTSCNPIVIKPISPKDVHNPDIQGLRFYEPAFYLAVGGDKDGNCQATIIKMNDTSRPFVAQVFTFPFTNSSVQLTREEGWNLTGVNSSVDSTTLATTLAGLAGGGAAKTAGTPNATLMSLPINDLPALAEEVKKQNEDPEDTDRPQPPGLYRIRFDDDGNLKIDSEPQIRFGGKKCVGVLFSPTATSKGANTNSGEDGNPTPSNPKKPKK